METKLPQDVFNELQRAIERAALGVRDPEEAARASERLEKAREKLKAEHGELNLAVELIREVRDE